MYYPGTCHACYHMLWHVVSTEVQFNTISTSWEYCCCSCLSLLLRLPTSAICLVFDGETCFLGQFVCVQLHPSSPVCVCVCVCVPPYLTQSKSRPASDQSFGAPAWWPWGVAFWGSCTRGPGTSTYLSPAWLNYSTAVASFWKIFLRALQRTPALGGTWSWNVGATPVLSRAVDVPTYPTPFGLCSLSCVPPPHCALPFISPCPKLTRQAWEGAGRDLLPWPHGKKNEVGQLSLLWIAQCVVIWKHKTTRQQLRQILSKPVIRVWRVA